MPRLPRPRLPRPRLRRPLLRRPREPATPPEPATSSEPTPPSEPTAPPEPAAPPRPRRPSRLALAVRGARYRIADVLSAAGRIPIAVGRAAREFWWSLSISARRRLVLVVGVVAALLFLAGVAVPALPCQAPGGDTCPPADDAVGLVPKDALAYAHVNVDPDTDQFKDAEDVANRIPSLSRVATGRLLASLPGPGGRSVDFAKDIEPWFGGEAAMAVVPSGARAAEEVQLLEASDSDGARKFADGVASGKPTTTAYRGIDVRVDRRGLATAVVGGFLAIGRESGVRDVIDAQSGEKGTGSLADDPAADDARDALPDKRLADVYLSKNGISRFVASPRGPLSTFAAVVNPGASRGVAAALVANGDGVEVDVRSELHHRRAKTHPGFFTAFPTFSPTLAGSLPENSLGYLGIGNPGETFASLLRQAAAEEPGLATAVGGLVGRVRQLGNVNLAKDLLPALGDEAAFALEPTPARASGGKGGGGKGGAAEAQIAPPPGASQRPVEALPASRSPFVEFIGKDVDAKKTSRALDRLQAPIAEALAAGSGGETPKFARHKVGDVTAQSLRVSPTVELTYAVVESALVVATNPAGVDRAVAGEEGLDGTDSYDAATDGFPGDLSVLAYLDLRGLITLAEQAGLADDPAYATFAPEIRRLEAMGLAVNASRDELATDTRLVIGEATGGEATGVRPTD